MTYYHGTAIEVDFTQVNPERGRYDVCLTDDRDVAQGYAEEMGGGTVYEVSLDCRIEDLTDCAHIIEELTSIELDGPFAYLALDDVEIQEALVEEGIYAVQYEDEDWDNEPHKCVRVLVPGKITVN